MAECNSNDETKLRDDVWNLVFLSQQANSLLSGAKELISDPPDGRAFDCLQILEVAIDKLSGITAQYSDLKISERLEAVGVRHA